MVAYESKSGRSGAYSALTYKTAWLSCYHPVEWAVACLMVHDKKEKKAATLKLCKKRGIKILPPTINTSGVNFTIEDVEGEKAIRYGLSSIQGIGAPTVKYIEDVRKACGGFENFTDFYNKVHDKSNVNMFSQKINKNGVKSCPLDKGGETALINAGAFDEFEENRYELLNYYNEVLRCEKDYEPLDPKDYHRKEKLALEKEFMGEYISEHPLDPFPYVNLDKADNEDEVEIAGIVKKFVTKKSKRNEDFGMLIFEPKDGIERMAMMFGKTYEDNKSKCKKDKLIIIKGTYNKKFNNVAINKIKEMVSKSKIENKRTKTKPKAQIEMPIRDIE